MTDPATESRADWDERVAFVTIGATAGFRPLVEEVVSEPFLAKLEALGFTELIVQCGPDHGHFEAIKPRDGSAGAHGLKITGFPFTKEIEKCMRKTARGTNGGVRRGYGVIISHAGSGSIMAALRYDTKLIAVPNPSLMDNHQAELAEEMELQGYAVQGKLGALADAVEHVENHAPKNWPPTPPADSAYQNGLWEAISENMPKSSSYQPSRLEDFWRLFIG
ncbi:glycosyltransferase family 28 C-terminal domain-containing protein [Biscogniauxia marginata]|nr:glycosyltransferase family 28 C-terminal domain-containing protein [Biscogniauxia marginata]